MHYLKKSLGQNFLIDHNIIKKIVKITKIYNKNILEIGPGRGALTEYILREKPKSLILIEKDNILSKELKEKYKNNKTVTVYNNDILKIDFESKMKENSIIFGNLPYNISSQILVKIINFEKKPPKYQSLILMFQKEVAERIIGAYGTKDYGRLSILANYRLDILNKFNVSPNSFFPKPKVNSTILFFKSKKKLQYKIKNLKNLEKITKILFSNRRKMVNKSLRKLFDSKKLEIIKDLNQLSRPADLKPEIYYEITKLYEEF